MRGQLSLAAVPHRLVAGRGKQPEYGFLQRIGIRSGPAQGIQPDSPSRSNTSTVKSGGNNALVLAALSIDSELGSSSSSSHSTSVSSALSRPVANGPGNDSDSSSCSTAEEVHMVHFVTAPAENAAAFLAPVVAAVRRDCPTVISIVRTDAPGFAGDGSGGGGGGGGVGGGGVKPGGKKRAAKAAAKQKRRGTSAISQVLWGESALQQRLGGLTFDISAGAFFQTNTMQAAALHRLVAEAAELRDDRQDIVVDLFCGAGFFGLALASDAAVVHGFELSASAVANAEANAAANGVTNAFFRVADLDKAVPSSADGSLQPDIIVADPGRAGMARPLLGWLRTCTARRLVYVSCNPVTQARDLAELLAPASGNIKGALEQTVVVQPHGHGRPECGTAWKLEWLQPLDMFPQTSHVECVAVLSRH